MLEIECPESAGIRTPHGSQETPVFSGEGQLVARVCSSSSVAEGQGPLPSEPGEGHLPSRPFPAGPGLP